VEIRKKTGSDPKPSERNEDVEGISGTGTGMRRFREAEAKAGPREMRVTGRRGKAADDADLAAEIGARTTGSVCEVEHRKKELGTSVVFFDSTRKAVVVHGKLAREK